MGPSPTTVSPAPFHTPFRDLASLVPASRLKPAPARPAGPRAAVAPSTTAPEAAKAAPAATATPPAVSEAETLAAALAGVKRLKPAASRVVARPRRDFSRIEAARREDLDSLARGEGFDVTFHDHFVRARAAGVSLETLARVERGEFPICAHLDLHGLPLDEARRAVDDFLAEQQKKGRRCVLLITGKGKNSPRGLGVLREQVPEWLARGPSARRVLAFASARECDGGVGALVVLMRASSSSKNRIVVESGGVGGLEA